LPARTLNHPSALGHDVRRGFNPGGGMAGASAPYLSLPLARGVPRLCLSNERLDQAQRKSLIRPGACGATATHVGLSYLRGDFRRNRETPHAQFDIALIYSAPNLGLGGRSLA
jgi:hypothetical protein